MTPPEMSDMTRGHVDTVHPSLPRAHNPRLNRHTLTCINARPRASATHRDVDTVHPCPPLALTTDAAEVAEITATQVADVTGPMGLVVSSERQARELAPLLDEPEKLREVWTEAIERSNGNRTHTVDLRPAGSCSAEMMRVRESARMYTIRRAPFGLPCPLTCGRVAVCGYGIRGSSRRGSSRG